MHFEFFIHNMRQLFNMVIISILFEKFMKSKGTGNSVF